MRSSYKRYKIVPEQALFFDDTDLKMWKVHERWA